jgi:hypothetical protein
MSRSVVNPVNVVINGVINWTASCISTKKSPKNTLNVGWMNI